MCLALETSCPAQCSQSTPYPYSADCLILPAKDRGAGGCFGYETPSVFEKFENFLFALDNNRAFAAEILQTKSLQFWRGGAIITVKGKLSVCVLYPKAWQSDLANGREESAKLANCSRLYCWLRVSGTGRASPGKIQAATTSRKPKIS